MKSILIIEDDIYISNMLAERLEVAGYRIFKAYSGTEAILFLSTQQPDLILLDLMLPGLSGEEVLQKIHNIPVIVLSAKAEVNDKVKLLLNGASDYITKPFNFDELLARIIVQLRNAQSSSNTQILRCDDIQLNTISRAVTIGGKPIKLTRTEYAILKYLLQNPEQVITKSQMLHLISQDTPDCTETTLKVHISNLRIKLRESCSKDYIQAVWGIGFKFIPE
ncbi:response regulator transcription factor [Lysinibacillus agricola]|uniref:response regulator transcription factor n=1 Tax=Lysinibacillus agricola TaxID=2590012 RepID=UPI003C250BFE